MAVVILGGLATSTILNLLVLPTLALRFARFTPASEEWEERPHGGLDATSAPSLTRG